MLKKVRDQLSNRACLRELLNNGSEETIHENEYVINVHFKNWQISAARSAKIMSAKSN